MRILLLFLTLAFTQELEVEGDLKVTGNIDAQNQAIKNVGAPADMNDAINAQVLQNALTDNGPFEIEYYQVYFRYGHSTSGPLDIKYRGDGETDFTDNWPAFINQKSLEGWSHTIFHIGDSDMTICELKRKIEEE